MKTIPSIALFLAALSVTGQAHAGPVLSKLSSSASKIQPLIQMEPVQGNKADFVPPVDQQKVKVIDVIAINPRPATKAVVPGVAQPVPGPIEVEKPKQPEFVIEEPAVPEPSSAPAPSSPPVLTKAERRQQVKDCVSALPPFPDLSGLTKSQRNQAIRNYKDAHFSGVNTCLVASGFPPKEPKNKDKGAGTSMSADAESSGSGGSPIEGGSSESAS